MIGVLLTEPFGKSTLSSKSKCVPILETMQKLSSKCCHFKKHWINREILRFNMKLSIQFNGT